MAKKSIQMRAGRPPKLLATRRAYRQDPITNLPTNYYLSIQRLPDQWMHTKSKILCYSQYKEIQDLKWNCLQNINEIPKIRAWRLADLPPGKSKWKQFYKHFQIFSISAQYQTTAFCTKPSLNAQIFHVLGLSSS